MKPKQKGRYDRCSSIPDSDVEITATGWSVRTQDSKTRASGLKYTVKRNKFVCKFLKCDKSAPPCKHLYICDCPDFSNPCKHIFKIYTFENCSNVLQVVVPSNKSRGKHHFKNSGLKKVFVLTLC